LLCGNAPVFAAAVAAGAAGGILAVACCAPGAALALYAAAASGRLDEARRLQAALMPLADAVTTRHGVAGLKLAMDLAGLRGGSVRAPLLPAPPEAEDVIRDALAQLRAALA
jgi:dihydrodipicolinate synthase/N-acetylneuraminate lyase